MSDLIADLAEAQAQKMHRRAQRAEGKLDRLTTLVGFMDQHARSHGANGNPHYYAALVAEMLKVLDQGQPE